VASQQRKIAVGDKLIEDKVGRKIRWELQFSKTSPGFQSGEYDFYFKGDAIGLDSVADLVDTAEMSGIISRTGAWYNLEDGSKVQGRDAFVKKVKEDSELYKSIEDQLNGI